MLVRVLLPQPCSPDTLGDFQTQNFVPSFSQLSAADCGEEKMMVPICSILLPNKSVSLYSLIFDFRFRALGLARDRFEFERRLVFEII